MLVGRKVREILLCSDDLYRFSAARSQLDITEWESYSVRRLRPSYATSPSLFSPSHSVTPVNSHKVSPNLSQPSPLSSSHTPTILHAQMSNSDTLVEPCGGKDNEEDGCG